MNSPATFQTMMDNIFQDEIAQGWLRIYMDDMIIATEDDKVLHELCVNHILDKLEKFDLFLKPEKCKFHQREVEYLGVLIGNGTVKMDPIKVQVLRSKGLKVRCARFVLRRKWSQGTGTLSDVGNALKSFPKTDVSG